MQVLHEEGVAVQEAGRRQHAEGHAAAHGQEGVRVVRMDLSNHCSFRTLKPPKTSSCLCITISCWALPWAVHPEHRVPYHTSDYPAPHSLTHKCKDNKGEMLSIRPNFHRPAFLAG